MLGWECNRCGRRKQLEDASRACEAYIVLPELEPDLEWAHAAPEGMRERLVRENWRQMGRMTNEDKSRRTIDTDDGTYIEGGASVEGDGLIGRDTDPNLDC